MIDFKSLIKTENFKTAIVSLSICAIVCAGVYIFTRPQESKNITESNTPGEYVLTDTSDESAKWASEINNKSNEFGDDVFGYFNSFSDKFVKTTNEEESETTISYVKSPTNDDPLYVNITKYLIDKINSGFDTDATKIPEDAAQYKSQFANSIDSEKNITTQDGTKMTVFYPKDQADNYTDATAYIDGTKESIKISINSSNKDYVETILSTYHKAK